MQKHNTHHEEMSAYLDNMAGMHYSKWILLDEAIKRQLFRVMDYILFIRSAKGDKATQ